MQMVYLTNFISMITIIPPVFVNELSDEIKVNDNEFIHVTHSDVYLLLNQKRIESYKQTDVAKYFSLASPSSDTSQFTDEQLMDSIKSRRIQSPSDLKRWSDFLDNCSAVYKDNVANEAKEIYSKRSKASKSKDVPTNVDNNV